MIKVRIDHRPSTEEHCWLNDNIGSRTWVRGKGSGWMQKRDFDGWAIYLHDDTAADLVKIYFG